MIVTTKTYVLPVLEAWSPAGNGHVISGSWRIRMEMGAFAPQLIPLSAHGRMRYKTAGKTIR